MGTKKKRNIVIDKADKLSKKLAVRTYQHAMREGGLKRECTRKERKRKESERVKRRKKGED